MAEQSTDHYRRIAHDLIQTEFRVRVISDSMRPLLRRGDEVLVQPIAPAALRVGDVVVIRHGSELITHRLIAIDRQGWQLRGDAAIWADEPVGIDAIVGRVRSIERAAQTLDVNRAPWPTVNRRVSQIGLAHERLLHRLHLDRPVSQRWQVALAWLSAWPVRGLIYGLITTALKRTF